MLADSFARYVRPPWPRCRGRASVDWPSLGGPLGIVYAPGPCSLWRIGWPYAASDPTLLPLVTRRPGGGRGRCPGTNFVSEARSLGPASEERVPAGSARGDPLPFPESGPMPAGSTPRTRGVGPCRVRPDRRQPQAAL